MGRGGGAAGANLLQSARLCSAARNDSAAWEKGPDQIVCVYSSDPSQAKENHQEVVGAAIGLKAGSRMVRIEAIGVYTHAFVMLKLFAGLSGGRYLTLEK